MSELRTETRGGGVKRTAWLLAAVLAVAGSYLVLDPIPADAADGADQAPAAEGSGSERLISRLQALRPELPIERVAPAPIPGMFQLELAGGTVLYGTADGRYLFAGDLYELGEHDLINLAEQGRTAKRQALLASLDPADMVIFPPDGKTAAVIAVFTDVDCGYCRKLHQEVPKLNEMGIEVRYLAYPRAGIGSRSYQKIVSAWCADDPNTAITRLKAGESIPDATCSNPVADHYALGQQVGVTGTPAILLEDGRLLPGYLPADALAQAIGLRDTGT